MFLYSMIWAFGSILTDEAKGEFEAHLRKVFHEKAQRDKALSDQRGAEEARRVRAGSEESLESRSETSRQEDRYEPTPEFAMGSIDEMQSTLPENIDLFDMFFDVSSNAWRPWKHVYTYCLEEKTGFAERIRKHLLTTVCWTQDLLRYRHILDKVCPTNQSLLLFGRTATGKSTLIRNYLSQQDGVTKTVNFEAVSFTPLLQSNKLQSIVEARVAPTSKAVF